MPILLELLAYILIEFLFTTPGAFVRWVFLNARGRKITFKECLTYKIGLNYLISILLTGAIVSVVYLVVN